MKRNKRIHINHLKNQQKRDQVMPMIPDNKRTVPMIVTTKNLPNLFLGSYTKEELWPKKNYEV